MSDNNQFQPYRYNPQHDQQQPGQSNLNISASRQPYQPGGDGIAAVLRRPFFATIAFLVGAVVLAGVLISVFSGSDEPQNVPVVTAENTPYKAVPESLGGMDIPNRDSTIFQSANVDELDEEAPVENLLEEEPPVSKLEAFAKDAEAMMDKKPEEMASNVESEGEGEEAIAQAEEAQAEAEQAKPRIIELTAVPKTKPIIPGNNDATAASQPEPAPQSETIQNPPGSSPETLAFVRSVLDKKDNADQDAAEAAKQAVTASAIQPSAGTSAITSANTIQPGSYYVQLGSVTSQMGAHDQWTKIKSEFSSQLKGADYRVKEANLGERGTYYRIQVGPMSKESADRICGQIKEVKPQGCLIVR